MPKEIVTAGKHSHVVVGWSKEAGYAQLGVVNSDAPIVINGEEYDSLWADLKADEIDGFIKLLKKIKRQAFSN